MTYLILLFLRLGMGISLQGDINLPQLVLQSVLGTLDLPELKLHSILYFVLSIMQSISHYRFPLL